MPTYPTCQSEAIENTALGKPLFYCRTCKVEVGLPTPVVDNFDFGISYDNNIEWEIYQDDNGFPQWRIKQ